MKKFIKYLLIPIIYFVILTLLIYIFEDNNLLTTSVLSAIVIISISVIFMNAFFKNKNNSLFNKINSPFLRILTISFFSAIIYTLVIFFIRVILLMICYWNLEDLMWYGLFAIYGFVICFCINVISYLLIYSIVRKN